MFSRQQPYETKAHFGWKFKSLTDAGVHMLLQDGTGDRTFLVASVCRDIWQQLESSNFAIRGQVLLLVKEFVLEPIILTSITLRGTGVTDECKRQMRQVRAGLNIY